MIVVILRDAVSVMAIAALLVAADLFLRCHGGWRVTIRAARRFVNLGRRAFSRAVDLGVWLGHQVARRVYDVAEDLVLVLPPSNGRSSYLADRVISQPGAVTVASACPDVVTITGTCPDPPEFGQAGGVS